MYHNFLQFYGTNAQGQGQDSMDEGFENTAPVPGAVDESTAIVRWIPNEEIYDEFYASVYDNITMGVSRVQTEVGIMIHEWTKYNESISDIKVLDAGCGTGVAACSFIKVGVDSVVALDVSEAMIKRSRDITLPQTTLTEEERAKIEWRRGDVENVDSCEKAEFTHACMLYFTIYYFNDKSVVFRNLYEWVEPGGKLVIQVVNKHKFDPMMESSSPWLGFSLQKYAKKRVTKSEVMFNKFKYVGEFSLVDEEIAEFRETFRFKDGKIRRHVHTLKMDDISLIVAAGEQEGWEYMGYTDLTMIGFEYAYHLHFKHP